MKKMVFFGFLILSLNTYAGNKLAASFCHAYFEQENAQELTSKKPKAFKFLLKFLFHPSSLVEIEALKEAKLDEFAEKKGQTKILFNLLSDTEMTNSQKKELKRLSQIVKQNKKEIKNERLYENLKLLSNEEECISYIEIPHVLALIEKFENDYKKYQPFKEKEDKAKEAKLIKKKTKKFIKKGWKVFSSLNINQIHNEMIKNPGATVLMVGHATERGEVVDHKLNILPASFFVNTEIENLIIYTCYPDEVASFYQVLANKNIINYYLPRLNRVTEGIMSATQTPMNSIQSVLEIPFRSHYISYPEKKCSLFFNQTHEALAVFLNKTYLGSLKKEILFDCALLKERNSLEVYALSKEGVKGSLGLSLLLNHREQIQTSEFVSRVTGKHIVTKAQF